MMRVEEKVFYEGSAMKAESKPSYDAIFQTYRKKMPYQSGALSKVIRSPVDGWVKERWEA